MKLCKTHRDDDIVINLAQVLWVEPEDSTLIRVYMSESTYHVVKGDVRDFLPHMWVPSRDRGAL